MFRFGTGRCPMSAMSTALIPLAAAHRESCSVRPGGRPRADFLAQLIAVKAKLPQTRVRRRAEPEEAIAAYDGAGRSPMRPGGALSRSL